MLIFHVHANACSFTVQEHSAKCSQIENVVKNRASVRVLLQLLRRVRSLRCLQKQMADDIRVLVQQEPMQSSQNRWRCKSCLQALTWRSCCCNVASWACRSAVSFLCVASCCIMFWFNAAKSLTTAFLFSSAIMLINLWPERTIFSVRTSSKSPDTFTPQTEGHIQTQQGASHLISMTTSLCNLECKTTTLHVVGCKRGWTKCADLMAQL